ncbi:uncharacterized protein LOC143284142 [Babylonia areolata]|uniref:uncharacterized protein LOC143284142 n=1 Tax=Babylonia areolata TaxID=304850 RepID=UPI003FD53EA2
MSEDMKKSLELKMAQMGAKMTPQLPVDFNLGFLKRSMDVLVEALMFNPTLLCSMVPVMLELIKHKYSGNVSSNSPVLTHVWYIRDCTQASQSSLKALQKTLDNSQSSKKDVDKCVQHLLEQLAMFLSISRRNVWFDCRLNTILKRWTQCPNGWKLLVSSLCTDLHKVEQKMRGPMRELITVTLCWIAHQCRLEKEKCPMWQLSPALLAELAEFREDFCTWYISDLERIGDSLNEKSQSGSEEQEQQSTSSRGNPLGGDAANTPEQKALEERFQQLLMRETSVRMKVLSLIQAKLKDKSQVFSVWRSICSTLMKINSER